MTKKYCLGFLELFVFIKNQTTNAFLKSNIFFKLHTANLLLCHKKNNFRKKNYMISVSINSTLS